jgi:holo-[acyl-carrier protein] synthase
VIVGIGTDLVEVARLGVALERTPTLRDRLFTPTEAELPLESLAARFAAKEALAKALGAPEGLAWRDAEVVVEPNGRPRLQLSGSLAAAAEAAGVERVHLSLSHDGGFASGFVVLEGSAGFPG